MITLIALLKLVLTILAAGFFVWILLWLIDYVGGQFPNIPAPFVKVAKVIVVVFAVIWLLYALLPLIGAVSPSLR